MEEPTLFRPEAHTTQPHSERINELAAKTVPGMAHWSGTGPAGKTCLECLKAKTHGYYSKSAGHHGALKPISCRKFEEMMGQSIRFAWHRESCRFFEQSPEVPATRAK